MNEELEVREQPNCVTATVAEANNDELSINDNMGSLGKFKNANSLLKAYEDLEKEFTRKSQRLCITEKHKNLLGLHKQKLLLYQNL